MPLLLWDASGLAKRYTAEVGRDVANSLFSATPLLAMASTACGYAETYSILLRRLNGGILDMPTFTVAVTALQNEVVQDPDFALLTLSDSAIFASIAMMRKHNLNATDAAILTVFLDYSRSLGAPKCVLIAADKRLLRAAGSELLSALNPDALLASDVTSFLSFTVDRHWIACFPDFRACLPLPILRAVPARQPGKGFRTAVANR